MAKAKSYHTASRKINESAKKVLSDLLYNKQLLRKMKSTLLLLFCFAYSIAHAQTDSSTISIHKPVNTDSVYEKVDVEAQFPGGEKQLMKFYTKKVMSVIDELEKQKFSGTCEVSFIVDTAGNISNIQVLDCENLTWKNLIIDLMKKSPNWIPARKDDKAVTSLKKKKFTFYSSANLKN